MNQLLLLGAIFFMVSCSSHAKTSKPNICNVCLENDLSKIPEVTEDQILKGHRPVGKFKVMGTVYLTFAELNIFLKNGENGFDIPRQFWAPEMPSNVKEYRYCDGKEVILVGEYLKHPDIIQGKDGSLIFFDLGAIGNISCIVDAPTTTFTP
jgi:hypothetical protein